MCKPSKYNIYLTYKDKYYIFNQLSSELREVDLELYDRAIIAVPPRFRGLWQESACQARRPWRASSSW